jgi:precorrin-2 dehydrogenase/sirohydrochlorin ferrochelatase
VTQDPAFFPMLMSLVGRKCVVVGGGTVAAAKIDGLLHHGAEVMIVSPRAVMVIQCHARAGTLLWRRRAFSPRDLDGAFLTVAATNSPGTNAAIFRACTARGVLCNSVDDPEHCDFFYPSIVRRGPLQIAISTGGRSPALAARLRRELEQQFSPEWSAWVEHLGKQRDDLFSRKMSMETRRKRLLQMALPDAFRAFLRERSQPAAQKKRAPSS